LFKLAEKLTMGLFNYFMKKDEPVKTRVTTGTIKYEYVFKDGNIPMDQWEEQFKQCSKDEMA
jgi:hypothetical protein